MLLRDSPDHEVGARRHQPLRVVASTSVRHPVGEQVVGLRLPTGLEPVIGTGAGYGTPLPTAFAGDAVPQVILLPLHLPTGELMGALICGRQSDQPLTADEQAFAFDLGVEAGLAIRYARLFAREQEQIESLQRFQELQTSYFSMVAHEMKTPLTVLRTLTPALHQLSDLPDETRREIVEAINGNLARLEWAISSLLDGARLEAGLIVPHPRPLNLASSIRQVVEHISSWLELKRQRVSVKAAPDLPLVLADGSLTEHVITNLLVNAMKFAPEDSTIVVTLQPPGPLPAEQVMQVCVEDEGPGVPPEQQEWIFEKYHSHPATQANGGTGLGLWICREVVRRHGGHIWVEDRPGGGSRFCFTLPLIAEESVVEERSDTELGHEESQLQDLSD